MSKSNLKRTRDRDMILGFAIGQTSLGRNRDIHFVIVNSTFIKPATYYPRKVNLKPTLDLALGRRKTEFYFLQKHFDRPDLHYERGIRPGSYSLPLAEVSNV